MNPLHIISSNYRYIYNCYYQKLTHTSTVSRKNTQLMNIKLNIYFLPSISTTANLKE